MIAVQEWRSLPAVLSVSSIAVVIIYLVFAVLMTSVGKVEAMNIHLSFGSGWLSAR